MWSTLLVLTLAAPPGTVTLTDERAPEVVPFSGTRVEVALQRGKHRVVLKSELLDLVLDDGPHKVTEAAPKQLPGPLLLVGSELSKVDGEVVVVGAQGVRLHGPKQYSIFALEPFATRFVGKQLRSLQDNGSALFSAQTVDVVLVPEDFRYLRVVGLDPTARYRVTVEGDGPEQVLVIADREFPSKNDAKPADAEWSASRAALKGGESAALPPTRQLALTLAGILGVLRNPRAPPIQVVIEQTKAGKGELGPKRTIAIGNSSTQFILEASAELIHDGDFEGARVLVEQCVSREPSNAQCRLLLAKAWAGNGDHETAFEQACKARKLGAGTKVAEEAEALLGGQVSRCP